ncbi:hypothetical protein HF086_012301, partial [Spodoptera exigua]
MNCDDDDSTDASGPSGTAPASLANAFVNPTGEDEERRPSPPEDVYGAAEDGARIAASQNIVEASECDRNEVITECLPSAITTLNFENVNPNGQTIRTDYCHAEQNTHHNDYEKNEENAPQ